jgi:hypothetical protein
MRLTFKPVSGDRVDLPMPSDGAPSVDTWIACECGCVSVTGRDCRIVDDRYYVSDAHCVGCGAHRGALRVDSGTLFGIEEDRAVLVNGRCRVY